MSERFDRSVLAAMQENARRYHRLLHGDVAAMAWLAGRGLSSAAIDRYQLGLCDDAYKGRLAIPYLRPHGVVWFNYRSLDGRGPKYLASGRRRLFNTAALDQADVTGEVAICEGELDAIVATEMCGVPAVAVPGATQWTGNPHWRELFWGYQRVWVLADPDEAGLGLAKAIMESVPRARLVEMPGDVNETYLQHGGIRQFIPGGAA